PSFPALTDDELDRVQHALRAALQAQGKG
ncbi:hypothetical protein FHS87_003290, partial [Roseomonas pecuniae]|nr:hypothetical protein [Roseomonas pecuniae]MBB5695235.1 hypothetical protein [Roseomonas pecuniae]